VTGLATTVNGLSGTETNTYHGLAATVSQPADYAMVVDPGHEFSDVLYRPCGPNAVPCRARRLAPTWTTF